VNVVAIQPSDFTISLSPDPVGIVVGMNSNVSMSFTNTNTVDRGYNLTAELILPDGVSFVGSTITPTSVVAGPNGTIIVSWTNIKDLAPNEVDFQFQATVQADETFRETGESVPFDVPISAVVLNATVDTLPRGNDDPGNEEIPKTDSSNYIPLRYSLTKTAPSKMPKGAGLFIPETEPLWPYEYTLTVMNNSRMPSTVTLVDNLPNGVRYLGNLSVSGPDAAALSSPTVTIPSPGPDCQSFVTLGLGYGHPIGKQRKRHHV
jgi:hypothetical protein